MSHLDEGTLHALLDGELEVTEVKEIQAHLGSCTSCGSRLREVKEFLGESDRLVAAVQFPGSHSHPGAAAQATAAPPAPRRREINRELSSYDGPPPPLLLPDNPDAGQFHWRWLGGLRWVALVALAVGAGYIANEFRRGDDTQSALETRELAPIASAPQDAVVSPEEAAQADGGDTPRPESAAPAREQPRQSAGTRGAVRPAPEPAPPPAAPREEPQGPADGLEEIVESNEAEPDAGDDASAVDRRRAAAATAALDRDRRRSQAAAATAALDSLERLREAQERAAAAARSAPPAAPAPRTLEQRAQIYLRIGLDEAARQLGRPVHVIEGLSPLFMGLAQGRYSPGADDTRPVVRVVYQDSRGRLILLDQQRIRPGQTASAPGTAEPHWTLGEITLHLHGEVNAGALGSLRPRVR